MDEKEELDKSNELIKITRVNEIKISKLLHITKNKFLKCSYTERRVVGYEAMFSVTKPVE